MTVASVVKPYDFSNLGAINSIDKSVSDIPALHTIVEQAKYNLLPWNDFYNTHASMWDTIARQHKSINIEFYPQSLLFDRSSKGKCLGLSLLYLNTGTYASRYQILRHNIETASALYQTKYNDELILSNRDDFFLKKTQHIITMSNELGNNSKSVANAIIAACDEVLNNGKCMDQFPVDVYQGGAGTSVNMNTNEVLANIGLELMGHQKGEYQYLNPNDHVNKCQSTNDAYPTGFRIAVYSSLIKLVDAINQLREGFERKAVEFQDILKMGRTQLQDAVPMTLGQEFRAFSILLKEEVKNIERTAELLLEVNLGATAIGTGLNTPKEYSPLAVKKLAEVTGFPCVPAEDLIEATSDCGAYVMVHGALKRLAVKMSKICNDLRLLSSGPRAGLNEINLPELQAGSSYGVIRVQ